MTNEDLDRLDAIANEIAIAWVMAHQSDSGEDKLLAQSMIAEGARRWATDTGATRDIQAAAEAYMIGRVRSAYESQGLHGGNE